MVSLSLAWVLVTTIKAMPKGEGEFSIPVGAFFLTGILDSIMIIAVAMALGHVS